VRRLGRRVSVGAASRAERRRPFRDDFDVEGTATEYEDDLPRRRLER